MTLCLFSRFRRMSSQHIATLKITYWTALSDTKPVDRLRVLLRDRSHPGPLHRYRWTGGLRLRLWPLSPVVVMCKTALLALEALRGAASPAG